MTKLAGIMSSRVFTASPETSVVEAASEMVRRGFGSAVVVQGSLVDGIFTCAPQRRELISHARQCRAG
jgi:CBS domain-containing protein